jgi:hypothetical protein
MEERDDIFLFFSLFISIFSSIYYYIILPLLLLHSSWRIFIIKNTLFIRNLSIGRYHRRIKNVKLLFSYKNICYLLPNAISIYIEGGGSVQRYFNIKKYGKTLTT